MNWAELREEFGHSVDGPKFVRLWSQLDYSTLSADDVRDLETNYLMRARNDDFSKHLEDWYIWDSHQQRLKAALSLAPPGTATAPQATEPHTEPHIEPVVYYWFLGWATISIIAVVCCEAWQRYNTN